MTNLTFDDLFNAIRDQESLGSPARLGNSMQVQPALALRYGQGVDVNTPAGSEEVARRYLLHLHQTTGGDVGKMAAGYFGGEGGIPEKNWNRKDSNGRSINDYVKMVKDRLLPISVARAAQAQPDYNADFMSLVPNSNQSSTPNTAAPSTNAQNSGTPDYNADFMSLVPTAQQQPAAKDNKILGYTPQELYQAGQPAAEVAGALLGGVAGSPIGPGGSVAGAALGGAGANRLYELFGNFSGLKQPENTQQMLENTGSALMRNAVGEAGGQVLGKALSTAAGGAGKVGDIIRKMIVGEPSQQALSDQAITGIGISQPQASGRGLGLQRFLSAVPGGKGVFSDLKEAQLRQATDALDNAVSTLQGTRGLTRADIGDRVSTTFKTVVDNAFQARRVQGSNDFALIDASANGAPTLPINGFMQQLTQEMSRLQEAASPAAAARFRQLQQTANRIARQAPTSMLTGNAFNINLSEYGAAAAGNGSLFNNLSRDANDRIIAGRLYNALLGDLDTAANRVGPNISKPMAVQLQTARDNWRTASAGIKELQDTVLGRYLDTGTAIDTTNVYNRVIRMGPNELSRTARIIDNIDPTVMADVRTRYLDDIIEKSMTTRNVNESGIVEDVLNPNKLVNMLNADRQRTAAMLGPASSEVLPIVRQLSRVLTTGNPSRWVEHATIMTGGGLTIYPVMAGAALSHIATMSGIGGALYLGNRELAKALSTTQGRLALSTVFSNSSSSTAVGKAFSYLATQLDRED